MHANQPHYLPLPLPFFSILVGVFVFLVVLLQVRALRYAYMSIGSSAGGAMLVLLGSLVGSSFNGYRPASRCWAAENPSAS